MYAAAHVTDLKTAVASSPWYSIDLHSHTLSRHYHRLSHFMLHFKTRPIDGQWSWGQVVQTEARFIIYGKAKLGMCPNMFLFVSNLTITKIKKGTSSSSWWDLQVPHDDHLAPDHQRIIG